MRPPLVRKFTLDAGAISPVINTEFNFIHIRPVNSASFSDEISMKLDGGSFETVATGFGFGDSEISKQVQFRNDSQGELTFTVTLALGNVFSNNQNFDGDLQIGNIVIDPTSLPIPVEQQTSVDVLQSATVLALFNRMADALDALEISSVAIDGKLTVIDAVLDNVKTSNDLIATNTTP